MGLTMRHWCTLMIPMHPARTALLAIVLWCAAGRAAPGAPADAAGVVPALDAGTTLLVVSPHPDDETLCCAGVIRRVLAAGGRVSIVWITSGDGEFSAAVFQPDLLFSRQKMREFGLARMQEARRAAGILGVPPAGQLFLGYPDGSLTRLLGADPATVHAGRFTAAEAVPYPQALFPGHPFTGASLRADFAQVLERVHPTLILAPSLLDSHPDHSATGLLAMAWNAQSAHPVTMRFWIVHGGEGWPSPRDLSMGTPLPQAPLGAGLGARAFALEPEEEDCKLAAVRAYASQMRLMAPFLLAFVRSTELYSVRATVP
jgi:LmbE family N-acetylglucosaminyl deacetylase